MPLETQNTTLREAPYYDDYTEESNYHRVLFKPSVPVQTRELTQLQTILQNQIERFGTNIYKVGTIIRGCALTVDGQYHYVKLFDTATDGTQYDLPSLVNTYVVDATSNLHALSVNYADGSQSTNPDLQTMYLKYLNTGTGGEKQFANSATLTIYDRDYHVESVSVDDGGSGYDNNDIISFTGGSGSGAAASITTYANGTIRLVSVVENGTGYITAPTAAVVNSTGGTANGTGASLTAFNYKTILQVANSFYTNPVGKGYAVKTSEGIIFQKGHFVRVEPQEVVIEKYSNSPNNVVVGFGTTEGVVNASSNASLLDNANTTNYTAPGADRLKLTANIVSMTPAAAAANSDFMALYEFQDGRITRDRTGTQFNSVAKEFAKRTFEESGNYVVQPISLYSEDIAANTTHLFVTVGAGRAYVEGNRISLINNTRIPITKADTTITDEAQSISTSYGGYVYVNEMLGTFNTKVGSQITLRDAAANDVTDNAGGTPSAPGNQIGTARIRAIVYDSGAPGTPECLYRAYLFDVQMSSGKSFKDVASIADAGDAVADIYINPARAHAAIEDAEFNRLVFSTGTNAVQQLEDEEFIFRTHTDDLMAVAGTISYSFSGSNTLPYTAGQGLSSTQKRDFIVIPQSTLQSSTNRTGSVVINSGSSNVIGTSTQFDVDYQVGEYIKVGTQDPKRIIAINSNTSITVSNTYGATASAQTHTISFPANVPINMQDNPDRTINVDSSGTVLTIDINESLVAQGTITLYHDMKIVTPAVRVKSVKNPVYVKLSTDKFSTGSRGPWNLGIPDAIQITGVYLGTSNSYSDATTNYVSYFDLDKGQTDNFYGLSSIRLKNGKSLPIDGSTCMLVKVKALSAGTGKYMSTESYTSIIDDVTEPLPSNKIRTQDIPVFVSPKTGRAYDLRDHIDFRPVATATANVNATSVGGATVDPSSTVTFPATEAFFPSPTREFQASITSYLPRRDRVVLDTYGNLRAVQGIPSNRPSAPSEPVGCMTLGTIDVAPYPSLSIREAQIAKRPDLGVYTKLTQTRRYTMKDIADIDQRINRLEYYALLNTLEQNTKDLVIQSEANNAIERFKNGFMVDPMTDSNVSNLFSPEYRVTINKSRSIAQPRLLESKVDLEFTANGSSGVEKSGDLVHLTYDESVLVSQTGANKYRNCVEKYWNYRGNIKTLPEFDNYYDVTTQAVTVTVDTTASVLAAVSAMNDYLDDATFNTITDSVQTTNPFVISERGFVQTMGQDTNTTYTSSYQQIVPGESSSTTQQVGNYVTDFTMNPYIREQQIAVYATGLRPSSRHYAFFDNVDVSDYMTPCDLGSVINFDKEDFVPTGARGTALTANATGEIAALLDIPGGTYFTGERIISLIDVDDLDSESAASSKAIGKFAAWSFNTSKDALSISTKSINDMTLQTVSNTWSETTRRTWNVDNTPQDGGDGGDGDPISQTFMVQPQADRTDGLFLSSVDVYFKRKDPNAGVTVEIRETNEGGYPGRRIVSFSRVHKAAADITVSDDASEPTTFTFGSPIFVKNDTEYALVVVPDSNSPEYLIWTSRAGEADVNNSSIITNQNWGYGTLFYSTSGTSWTAVQDEDMKFTVRKCDFNTLSGTARLQNTDHEFLTVNNQVGTYRGGERVAMLSNNWLTGTLTTSTSNTVVATSENLTGDLAVGNFVTLLFGNNQQQSTGNVDVTGITVTPGGGETVTFTTDYSEGDFIRLGDEIRQIFAVTNATHMTIDAPLSNGVVNSVHYKMDEQFSIHKISAANSSTITLQTAPPYTSNSTLLVAAQHAVTGIVDTHDSANNKLTIAKSTAANDDFKFVTGGGTYLSTVVGATTQAQARIETVDNKTVNVFKSLINTLEIVGTSISMTGVWTSANGDTVSSSYSMNQTNKISFSSDALVKSKSNEISGVSAPKSLNVDLNLSAANKDVSPIIDVNPSSLLISKYDINNDTTDETGRNGSARAKYISKNMTLTDGMEAEDLRVYLTAYKPAGTDIKVYAKVLGPLDGENFDDKNWSEMTQATSSGLYSDSLNPNDNREFEFVMPKTTLTTDVGGAYTYSNTTIRSYGGTSFDTDFVAGDLVKIVKSDTETDYEILPIASVANASVMTVTSNVTLTNGFKRIEKFDQPQGAFKYNQNDYIIRYYDSNGAAHDTFKTVAIKIVLLSDTTYNIPTVSDFRAIALSV